MTFSNTLRHVSVLFALALAAAHSHAAPSYAYRVHSAGLKQAAAEPVVPAVPPSDANFQSVATLLHLDEVSGSALLDVKGGVWSATNLAAVANPKFGPGAVSFSTSGSAAVGPAINLIGDFTVEAWVRPTATDGFRALFGQWNQVPGQGGWLLSMTNGVPEFVFGPISEMGAFMRGGTAPVGSWSHLAATRQGASFRLFVNGALVTTYTSAAAGATLSVPITLGNYFANTGAVGASGAITYSGLMDDVRITVGVARYTSSFAVPTEAFPDK